MHTLTNIKIGSKSQFHTNTLSTTFKIREKKFENDLYCLRIRMDRFRVLTIEIGMPSSTVSRHEMNITQRKFQNVFIDIV